MGSRRDNSPGDVPTKGQTVIETVMMLLLLLLVFFTIVEFSRAWYLKNSLNNAARVGVRVAALDPALVADGTTLDCSEAGDKAHAAVCSSPGVSNSSATRVTVIRTEDVEPTGSSPGTGDTIAVRVNSDFETVLPELLTFMPTIANSSASMRYE